jgi:hypothetical protein
MVFWQVLFLSNLDFFSGLFMPIIKAYINKAECERCAQKKVVSVDITPHISPGSTTQPFYPAL